MDLSNLNGQPQTRWIALHGHLEGVELLIRMTTPQDGRKFHSRLLRLGIVKENRDNPLDVQPGREGDFFREIATQYVLDWRDVPYLGTDEPRARTGGPYSPEKMGHVLASFRRAFEHLMQEIADEDSFFGIAPSGSTPS